MLAQEAGCTLGGRKRGRMSEAWSQWEGHVVNGEFQLKKFLGGSEQSAVFLTEDPGQQPQPAAIKLIAADPANAGRQLSQWELAQGLLHPHLLRILDTGRCRIATTELIFAVMEYAEENLAQILPHRPMTPQEAREMLEPTLDTLAYLHNQGLVHGHLTPANILAINDQLKLASDTICRIGNEDAAVSGRWIEITRH
jgi:serine/threonine protein kinase